MYIYKEWYDAYAYTEERIELFNEFGPAKELLMGQIKNQFSVTGNTIPEIWENLIENGNVDPDEDTCSEGKEHIFIAIGNGDGDTSYYVIKHKEVYK